MRAISNNDTKLVSILLSFIENSALSTFVEEKTLKTPLHVCIEPVNYGSYQNVDMLEKLIKKGFDIN